MAIEASFCNPFRLVQLRDNPEGFGQAAIHQNALEYIRTINRLYYQQLGQLIGKPSNPWKIWRT
jgi:hypothetical protein